MITLKKLLNYSTLFLIFILSILSIVNILNLETNLDNSNAIKECEVFINQTLSSFDGEFINKDVYIFPEINNLLCLNKALHIEDNNFIYVGTNSKFINIFVLGILFIYSLFLFFGNKLIYLRFFLTIFLVYLNLNFSFNILTYNIILIFIFCSFSYYDPFKFKRMYFKFLDKKYIWYFIFFFLVVITQFSTHNYETMNWDINSFIGGGQDILLNKTLPYENSYENKGPILFLIYAFIVFLSNSNLLILKILNDLSLLLLSFLIYKFSKNNTKNNLIPILNTFIFILLMSKDWFHPGFSEIYTCIFLILSLNSLTKNNPIKGGLLFGLATLTNFGSIVFSIAFLLYFLFYKKINSFFKFSVGTSFVHLIFLITYFANNLLDIYLKSVFIIPVKYRQGNKSLTEMFGELIITAESFYNYTTSIYILITFLFSTMFASLFKNKIISNENTFAIFGLLIYILAGTAYDHQLIYFLCFLSLVPLTIRNELSLRALIVIVMISTFSIVNYHSSASINNLKNFNELNENYPVNNVAQELQYFDNSKLISFDNTLVYFYSKSDRLGYFLHPNLYEEKFILEEFKNLKLVDPVKIIKTYPDYIICSSSKYSLDCKNNKIISANYKILEGINYDQKFLHYYEKSKDILIYSKADS